MNDRKTTLAKGRIRDIVQYGSQIILGDSRKLLSALPEEQFQCCVTSPPYWGLRDYGVSNQIGAENDLNTYIQDLVKIFSQVKRTLKNDGTLWLNIGDSYTSGGRKWRAEDKKNVARAMSYRPPTPDGLKPKDLIGIPWRLAFALQEDGWYLRSDIIWHKPNCQPESVKDRPTRSHEYLFLFSKSKSYSYFSDEILENANGNGKKRNRRSVWSINTKGFNGSHFAVFPPELVRLCILAGSKENDIILDPFLGSGTVVDVCNALHRRSIGIEISEEYTNIAIQRVEKSSLELSL